MESIGARVPEAALHRALGLKWGRLAMTCDRGIREAHKETSRVIQETIRTRKVRGECCIGAESLVQCRENSMSCRQPNVRINHFFKFREWLQLKGMVPTDVEVD